MVHYAEHQPAEDVDHQDHHAGDGVALHEFRGAVHRAVKIGFGRDFLAAQLGFVRGEQAGVEIGVDRHLLAGHRIERETRRDFGNAASALGDHDEVDHHQDTEDEEADGIVAADQEIAEALDHMASGVRPGMSVDEHDAGRCDVERQAEQSREQQHRREG